MTGPRLVLAVNDARRKQLYWRLWRVDADGTMAALNRMDISYPSDIAGRIAQIVGKIAGIATGTSDTDANKAAADGAAQYRPHCHRRAGTAKYAQAWEDLEKSWDPCRRPDR